MTFPVAEGAAQQVTEQATQQAAQQVTPQVVVLAEVMLGKEDMERQEIQELLMLSDRENFRLNYLNPALEMGLVEMTVPDKPRSPKQKYRLTELGKAVAEKSKKE